ncbi:MAG: 4Fe-4S dicluster domain-containing protein, partial [Parachlamydiales bacterium]
MLKILLTRFKQKFRTVAFPKEEPLLPSRFRGLPKIDQSQCDLCQSKPCLAVCPTGALSLQKQEDGVQKMQIDLGKCLFCGKCALVCPKQALVFSRDYRLAVSDKKNLLWTGSQAELELASSLASDLRKLFGRSLRLRQVSAGGCNG